MFGIDVALLLGLRHATDPDHLTAVSTLVAADGGSHRARRLGFAWGVGHALTLFGFGLPVVLFGDELPQSAQTGAELAIGAIIVLLALRLLVRWYRGGAEARPAGEARSPRAAFGIGLVHGAGGSAASGALVVGAAGGATRGAIALAVFAGGTAISMAFASALFGRVLGRARGALSAVIPILAVLSLGFGVVYAVAAV